MKCGIYRIMCLENLKSYFGSTTDWAKRKSKHLRQLQTNTHHSLTLQRAWNKYGENNFVFDFIEEVPRNELLEKEQIYLDMLFDSDVALGFNISPVAGGGNKINWTLERRQKAREGNLGKILSNDTKAKIGVSNTGKVFTAERKEKIRKSKIGKKQPNISEALIGRKISEATKKKMSNAAKNRWRLQ